MCTPQWNGTNCDEGEALCFFVYIINHQNMYDYQSSLHVMGRCGNTISVVSIKICKHNTETVCSVFTRTMQAHVYSNETFHLHSYFQISTNAQHPLRASTAAHVTTRWGCIYAHALSNGMEPTVMKVWFTRYIVWYIHDSSPNFQYKMHGGKQ